MSQIHDAQYRLERERRQKIAEDRVRTTTVSFLERYQSELASIRAQGLIEYVQERYENCEALVSQIQAELQRNPFTAREISKSLGNEVYSLRNTAQRIKLEVEEQQYHQHLREIEARVTAKKQRKTELSATWTRSLNNWPDKLSLNLMLKELRALEKEAFENDSNETPEGLLTKLQTIQNQGALKAEEHRKQLAQEVQHDTNRDLATSVKEVVTQTLPKEKSDAIANRLNQICSASNDVVEQMQEIEQISNDADKQIEEEAIRRETVKAIFNTLKNTGFSVQKPKIMVDESGESKVVVSASRPAGNRAQFEILLDGSCTYKFDNYKGQTCKKDINQVLPKLSEVYGVDLSDSRVVWSNPDDEDAEMKPIPSQTMNSKG